MTGALHRWSVTPPKRALAGTAVVALTTLALPWQGPDPHAVDLTNALARPSIAHPLGTDHVGRDVLARLAAGGASSLIAVAVSLAGALGLGVAAGFAIAMGPRELGTALRLAAETALAVPVLVLALVVGAVLGAGPVTAGLAFAAAAWAPYALATARLCESVGAEPYILAARALGVTPLGLVRRHLLPAVRAPLGALAGADAGRAVILVASLGFLGVSADTGRPDWGAMVHEYRLHAFERPLLVVAPVAMIAILSLALHAVLDPGGGRTGARRRIIDLNRAPEETPTAPLFTDGHAKQ